MDMTSFLGLVGFLGACFAAAATGAVYKPGEWYEHLAKPSFRPPNWVFAPVWTLLYIMIAASGWLVWRRFGFAEAQTPLAIYGAGLVLNATWTFCFFGLHRPGLAFANLLALWVMIFATILAFNPLVKSAALLLLPYLAWVSFAGLLNFSIWRMNR